MFVAVFLRGWAQFGKHCQLETLRQNLFVSQQVKIRSCFYLHPSEISSALLNKSALKSLTDLKIERPLKENIWITSHPT